MQSIIFTSVQATTVFNVVVSLPVMLGYKEQSLLSGLLRSFLCVCAMLIANVMLMGISCQGQT